MVKTRYLFISHSWSYGDAYTRLCNLLNNAPSFSYLNYSVPQDDPIHNAPNQQALRDAIKRQMNNTQIVLVIAGVYATYSKWINIELDLAKRHFSKPVLGIKPYSQTNVSSAVRKDADLIVNWSTTSIVDGIRKLVA